MLKKPNTKVIMDGGNTKFEKWINMSLICLSGINWVQFFITYDILKRRNFVVKIANLIL